MNKQQLANKIWESANQMRSKIEANEYKDYILGFIFYKYLSDKEMKFLRSEGFEDEHFKEVVEENSEMVSWIQGEIGYFIGYENLFSTWLNMKNSFDVSNVRDALSAFERLISPTHKNVFKGIFDTLQTGLSKLGDTAGSQTKAINNLLELIKDIPMDGKQDYDVLGFIYEYLIGMFAANAGKKAGEFYTPHEVSVLMSEIVAEHLKDKRENQEYTIYDPTSGSGSLLINIGKSLSKHIEKENNIKYYAQELKQNTYNLTRMNLVMRGITPGNIAARNGDTLEDDWPYFDENDPSGTYDPLYVDAVVSNPPYSQVWDPTGKENDPRYSRFGLAPKGKADYAFLLHDLYHIKPDGIMTIVLPHGVLFRGGEEGEIRKKLIEQNHIDTIIGLPANIFFGTGIPTIIIVLKQHRENTDVLIIDASKEFVKEGKNNKLRACDIKKITDTFTKRLDIEKYSRKVSKAEIRANDYNLNIPRYVDSSEKAENYDLYASMFGGIPVKELDELKEYWEAFPNLRAYLFTESEIPYVDLKYKDIKEAVKNHSDILNFKKKFEEKFSDFDSYLNEFLIENALEITVSKAEAEISKNIFERLQNISLIDKYEAYQILDNYFEKISIDLEILQTESWEASKKVDPNMVLKKKDGKSLEVQEGYVGHIIPFEIVQNTILTDKTSALKEKENRLSEIPSEYEEILENLSEEEKEICNDILNEENDGFINKEIPKKIKELKAEKSEETKELLQKLMKVEKLLKEEKDLRAGIKKEGAELQLLTKETIEKLTDEEVKELLKLKWIEPIKSEILKMPESVCEKLIGKIKELEEKYETTYFDLETEIKKAEKELSLMIDDLCGDEFDMKGINEFKLLLTGGE